jgi:hypothetical protein
VGKWGTAHVERQTFAVVEDHRDAVHKLDLRIADMVLILRL